MTDVRTNMFIAHQHFMSPQSVMVLATTNCPWDLDDALRRRLEKRIYIPLPDREARTELFKICLRNIPVSLDVSIAVLAELSESYSGSDVYTACKDAAMMPMRRLLAVLSPSEIVEMKSNGEITVPKVSAAYCSVFCCSWCFLGFYAIFSQDLVAAYLTVL